MRQVLRQVLSDCFHSSYLAIQSRLVLDQVLTHFVLFISIVGHIKVKVTTVSFVILHVFLMINRHTLILLLTIFLSDGGKRRLECLSSLRCHSRRRHQIRATSTVWASHLIRTSILLSLFLGPDHMSNTLISYNSLSILNILARRKLRLLSWTCIRNLSLSVLLIRWPTIGELICDGRSPPIWTLWGLISTVSPIAHGSTSLSCRRMDTFLAIVLWLELCKRSTNRLSLLIALTVNRFKTVLSVRLAHGRILGHGRRLNGLRLMLNHLLILDLDHSPYADRAGIWLVVNVGTGWRVERRLVKGALMTHINVTS